MIQPTRRRFLAGLVGIVAAPAIVRVASIMPVKVMPAWQPMTATEVMAREESAMQALIKVYEKACYEAMRELLLFGRADFIVPEFPDVR